MSRPATPGLVARKLRQEAGFGCCKCGHPIYDYQHIVPYEPEHHFRVEDMMLLCPNHHREATVGAMTQAEQRRHKRNPYNVRRGLAEGVLTTSQSVLVLQLGSVFLVGDGVRLAVDAFPLLQLGISEEGTLQMSVSLYDENENLLVEIEQNQWITGDPLPWDFEFGIRWLTLRERARRISLHIDARKFPISLRGQLWYGGHQYRINKKGLSFGGKLLKGGGFENLGLVAQRIQLDTDTGGLSIHPDERFGAGVIVSQPTPAQRLTESLKAWQGLRYPDLKVRNHASL